MQLLQVLVRDARADLHGHRIRDAAEVLDVRAVQFGRAHADPRIVRRQVVPALPVRQEPRLRLLVRQLQTLVRGEELDAMRFVHRLAADGLEELERIGHRLHELVVVRRERGLADEREVPVLGVMQVREPAVDQRPHEVQRQRRALVAAQHQGRVRLAIGRRERRPVDRVAAVARQRHAVLRLLVGAARLRVLARHAADADDRLLQPDEHHERHLQQDLQLLHDVVGRALVEALGAVAALQQERFAALRLGELRLQFLDFPGRDDRRQPAELRQHAVQVGAITIGRLLSRMPALPARGVPIGRNVRLRHDGIGRRANSAHYTARPHGRPKKPLETARYGASRPRRRRLSSAHRGREPDAVRGCPALPSGSAPTRCLVVALAAFVYACALAPVRAGVHRRIGRAADDAVASCKCRPTAPRCSLARARRRVAARGVPAGRRTASALCSGSRASIVGLVACCSPRRRRVRHAARRLRIALALTATLRRCSRAVLRGYELRHARVNPMPRAQRVVQPVP